MPLLNDHLSIWEIAHRWNNLDPDKKHWFGLPLELKDSFRLMNDAILNAHLVSDLSMEKWHSKSDCPPEFFIRYHLTDIEQCIWGRKYNPKFFKSVGIMRWDFKRWCEMFGIPLPEFWFPPGWKIEPVLYIDNYDESEPNHVEADDLAGEDDLQSDGEAKLRASQAARTACRQIAERLWKEQPDINIASMVKHDLIQIYGGGNFYVEQTVRGWIADLAPSHIQGKRGRPKKE
ncbi:hypothetical protein [Methylomonas albis]|uniref:Uncharacterized protein n=1 Tax=Methylomonas albis TaxID=1854563 RepID=A0ABR9CZN8_9GAMM|nr:hypothetical protein [Methylomonas albis]MBD9356345.1 hypothetical protein [Methylomonas albis]